MISPTICQLAEVLKLGFKHLRRKCVRLIMRHGKVFGLKLSEDLCLSHKRYKHGRERQGFGLGHDLLPIV